MSDLSRVKHLVFSGGAMNGLAYVGALQLLESVCPEVIDSLDGLAGASIGALSALLVCIGYTSDTAQQVIMQFDIKSMFERWSGLSRLGVLQPELSLQPWVESLIADYMGKPDVSFAELYRRTKRDLVIVVTNLTSKRVEYWSRKSHPGASVCRAVIASMAMPLLFTPVKMGDELFVDGGLGDNFPVSVFPVDTTLGIRIHLDLSPPWDNVLDYTMALIDIKKHIDISQLLPVDAGQPKKPRNAEPLVINIPSQTRVGLNFFAASDARFLRVAVGYTAALLWVFRFQFTVFVFCRCCGIEGV